MAAYNGNDVHLKMNNKDTGAIWRGFDMSLSVPRENTSAGAGIDWESGAAKLAVVNGTITLVYDDATAAADMQALYSTSMVVPVEYGPEGNAAGKPAHHQNFQITGIAGPTTNYDKTLVTLAYTVVSVGTPTKNFYKGDTW